MLSQRHCFSSNRYFIAIRTCSTIENKPYIATLSLRYKMWVDHVLQSICTNEPSSRSCRRPLYPIRSTRPCLSALFSITISSEFNSRMRRWRAFTTRHFSRTLKQLNAESAHNASRAFIILYIIHALHLRSLFCLTSPVLSAESLNHDNLYEKEATIYQIK
ncbi:unnamed protein product [Nesidiocoris tenuis]|uniref:Uncharacterized protein n=1 Tax=Nesidiocoris tenuis TaxID=355587 RepID=A0A6H5HKG1_9HEMI|nr:unnamed protein product [Nesidiocoris tenuis]